MASKKKQNPYKAGWGLCPPHFAGRKDEMRDITNALAIIQGAKGRMERSPATPIVMHGPHGAGKTVLLERTIEEATKRGIHTARVAPEDLSGPEEKIIRHFLKGKELEEYKGSLNWALEHFLKKKPMLLLIEHAHHCDIDELDNLLFDVQSCISSCLPLAPIITGTPVLEYISSRGKAGYMERSRFLRIGNLSDDESAEALEIPARESGRPIESGALRLLLEWSGNFPYFIQMAGSFAWAASSKRDGKEISVDDAMAGMAEAKQDRDAFYKDRLKEVKEKNLEEFAIQAAEAIQSQDGEKFNIYNLADKLKEHNHGREGFNAHRTVNDLMEVSFLWDPKPGNNVVPGSPSIFDYVLGKENNRNN